MTASNAAIHGRIMNAAIMRRAMESVVTVAMVVSGLRESIYTNAAIYWIGPLVVIEGLYTTGGAYVFSYAKCVASDWATWKLNASSKPMGKTVVICAVRATAASARTAQSNTPAVFSVRLLFIECGSYDVLPGKTSFHEGVVVVFG